MRGEEGGDAPAVPGRRGYLDWLRGVAVLIMIGSHTLDAWTRVDDRARPEYAWAMIVAGLGAPAFLFLAGIALALAGATRLARGVTPAQSAALARRRAWQIVGLAFAFRLQAWVISGGTFTESVLKVDVLNVMGVSLLAAAVLWGLGRGARSRVVLLASAAVAVAMVTPVVRSTPLFDPLPDPLEWYLRPAEGRAGFTLLPWGGFVLAGAALGTWLALATRPSEEGRFNLALAGLGLVVAGLGYAASLLPPLYENASFWTSSPTFFGLRVGILMIAVSLAYAWNRWRPGRSPLRELGRASLLVYWIHVEMVYGVVSAPIHRRLALEQALLAFVVLSVLLYGLARLIPRVAPARVAESLARIGFIPKPTGAHG